MSESSDPLQVKCGQCGHKNSLGRMFCSKCGAKLEVSKATVKSASAGLGGVMKIIGRLVRIVISLALLLGLIALLRPVVPDGQEGSVQEAQQLVHKLRLLKTATLDGRLVADTLLETEINGYLNELLKRSQTPSQGALSYQLKKINVAITSNDVTVVLAAACGPLTISYEIVGVPELAGNRFNLVITDGRLGHMPLPKLGRDRLVGKIYTVFSPLHEEKSVLDSLASLHLQEDQVAVSTRGQR